jgi:signal transduction histidine kinase
MELRAEAGAPFIKPTVTPSFIKRGSIRLGFLRLLALLLTIALLCTALLVWSAYDFARDQAKRQILDTARALSRVLDGEFARDDLMLRTLAVSPSVARRDWRAVDQEARSILPARDSWITVTDPNGRQLVNTRQPAGTDISGRVGPVRTWPGIDRGKTHICDLETMGGGERNLCIEIPLLQNGRPADVLSIWLRSGALAMVVARQRLRDDWRATILDSQNDIVWRSRFVEQVLGRKALPDFLKAKNISDEGIYPGTDAEGRRAYVAYSRSPASRWSFIILVPRGLIDAGIWPGLTAGLVLVVALMVIGVIASVRWMRRFASSVDALAAGAAALARRDHYHQPDTRIQELNDIAAALGDADRTLKVRDVDLERLNASLAARVEAAVATREVALRHLNETRKLETLGQLTGGVAHDFNNLLSPIMGALEMLQIRLAGDAKNARLIDAALSSSERAKLLVSRLLAFSRRQALRPQAVDVSALVGDMADLIRHSLGSSIKVTVDAAPGLAAAYVDRNQLELALLNLSVNARDAMPKGGTLSVSVSQRRPTADEMPAVADCDYIRIRLADTGAGMDEEILAHAIEPFFTTKPRGQGTGLGLSMVHGLAAQSGGGFVLSSTLGLGTCADIWLPVCTASSTSPNDAHKLSPGSVSILLVDDEEMVRGGIAEILLDVGFKVTDTSSPAEALAMIRQGVEVGCLVTDYKMPGMDGAALIAAARELVPALPVVLMSGYSGQDRDIVGVETLEKPFRQKHLIQAIEAAIGRPAAPGAGHF